MLLLSAAFLAIAPSAHFLRGEEVPPRAVRAIRARPVLRGLGFRAAAPADRAAAHLAVLMSTSSLFDLAFLPQAFTFHKRILGILV